MTHPDLPDEPPGPWAAVGCLLVLGTGGAFWGGVAWVVVWGLG